MTNPRIVEVLNQAINFQFNNVYLINYLIMFDLTFMSYVRGYILQGVSYVICQGLYTAGRKLFAIYACKVVASVLLY